MRYIPFWPQPPSGVAAGQPGVEAMVAFFEFALSFLFSDILGFFLLPFGLGK